MRNRLTSGLALAAGSITPALLTGRIASAQTGIQGSGGGWMCFVGGGALAAGALTLDPLLAIAGGILMTAC